MKLKLNKKTLKNLSNDSKALPAEMTPLIGGGARELTKGISCQTAIRIGDTQTGPTLCTA